MNDYDYVQLGCFLGNHYHIHWSFNNNSGLRQASVVFTDEALLFCLSLWFGLVSIAYFSLLVSIHSHRNKKKLIVIYIIQFIRVYYACRKDVHNMWRSEASFFFAFFKQIATLILSWT